jgi:flavin-dependent dehydrogenase
MVAADSGLIPPADEISIENAQVIIIGAGPVGLFLALKLAKAGVDVLVLEAEGQVSQSPRATTYVCILAVIWTFISGANTS